MVLSGCFSDKDCKVGEHCILNPDYQKKMCVGSDKKYCDLAIDLKKQEIILEYKKISCGHRVILEQPEEIYGLLFNFLS